MSPKMQLAQKSIIDLHVLIENVFTGRNGSESLGPLLASFDNNYKMVTMQGHRIGLAEVTALFSENVGKKATLETRPSDIAPLFECENMCWLQYQEWQQIEGKETLRTSTVCIHVDADKCTWMYLHETPALLAK